MAQNIEKASHTWFSNRVPFLGGEQNTSSATSDQHRTVLEKRCLAAAGASTTRSYVTPPPYDFSPKSGTNQPELGLTWRPLREGEGKGALA